MLPSGVLLTLTLAALTIPATEGLRILGMFPHPAMSHFRFFEPVLRGLANAGHDVTVVGMFPWKDAPSNYRDISMPGDILTNAIDLQDEWFLNRRKFGHLYEINLDYVWGVMACENAYNSTGLQQILRDRPHFDVILMEHFNNDCLMGVAWHLRAPVISMSSCVLMPYHHDRIGNPHLPSYIPSVLQASSERMTFVERLYNFVDIHLIRFLYTIFINPYTDAKLRQVFGDKVPPVADLVKTTSLMFVNQHYSMIGARPLSPAMIELGGIHIKEAAPLASSIKQYLDEAVEGVVFVSWGSMVRTTTLPDTMRQALVDAFGALTQRVLWKWDNETLPDKPENVRIERWLQQRDILCHPNVRVFVSHGGLLGSSESVHCGVPMVLTPLFGDQFHNSAAFVNRKIGAIVHYEDITKQSMLDAIHTTLQPEYTANAKAVAYSFNTRIRTPLETAIWWVEYVAATRGAPLTKSHSVFMPGWTYHSLDVIGVLAAGVAVIVASWWWALRRCFGRSTNSGSEKLKSQ